MTFVPLLPPRLVRRALVPLTAAALVAPLVATLPAADAAPAARRLSPMPNRPQPGTWRKPVYPPRAVPAYFSPTAAKARVRAGDGSPSQPFLVPTPAGSRSVWGDWDGNGTFTPAVFRAGTWQLYEAMIGPAPAPARTLHFGTAGDVPLAGDWNGDGRSDIGVRRGNRWYLTKGTKARSPRTWRHVSFGRAGDQPVVGDWDGDGDDGIGVFRRGTWFLRQRVRTHRVEKVAFGVPKVKKRHGRPARVVQTFRPRDRAVVGDWNGDGVDTVGTVRGSRWFLKNRNETGKGTASQVRVVTRPKGGVAAPWPTVAGPTGAACPTARRHVARHDRYVVASKKLDKARPDGIFADVAQSVRKALWRVTRYLVGTQYAERWASRQAQVYTDVRSRQGSEELAIRRPAMAALTAAIDARTSAHSTTYVGRSEADVLAYADWLVRSIACEHAAVTPGGWGSGWQTALWATLAGEAGWLLWDELTPQTRAYVADMVLSEAEHQLGQPTAYWTDRSGTVLPGYAGNTRAEEDAWNAALLELAVAMMPSAPHAKQYRAKAVALEAAAYSTRSDLTSSATVNGIPLSTRLAGSNILDDGVVVNHQIVHPDYASNIQYLWWAGDLAGLAGHSAPQAAFHNGSLVYSSLSTLSFTAGAPSEANNGRSYLSPGGTVYRPGSAALYYPEGSDWGTGRMAPFMSLDAHALAFSQFSGTARNPLDALAAHTAGQVALSTASGSTDGRTYSVDPAVAATQDTYGGREEYAAQQVATAWLALYVHSNARVTIDPARVPMPAAYGGVQPWEGWRQPGTSSSTQEQSSP